MRIAQARVSAADFSLARPTGIQMRQCVQRKKSQRPCSRCSCGPHLRRGRRETWFFHHSQLTPSQESGIILPSITKRLIFFIVSMTLGFGSSW